MFNWFDKLLVKIAKKILNKYAPTGEFIAYINEQEEKVLKKLGGYGQPVNETGVKSFIVHGDIWDWATKNWQDLVKYGGGAAKYYLDYKDQKRRNEMEEAAYNEYMKQVESAGQEARAAIDLNLTPMEISNIPQTKADVTDFTAVAARGGLMSIPNKQRKRYAKGPDPEDIPIMDDLSPPFDPREEGVIIGEQVFYDTGRGDRANAMQIWNQMQDPDKAIFDFDFEIFFMDGSWSDMIKSEVEVEGDTRTASAPSIEDSQNEMAMNLFGKPYHELNQEELDILNEQGAAPSANGIMQVAKGGRIGYQVGTSDIPGIPGVGKAMRDQNYLDNQNWETKNWEREQPFLPLDATKNTEVLDFETENPYIQKKEQEEVSTTNGNQIQEAAMTLVNSGIVANTEEALEGAHMLNAVENKIPGVTKLALALIEAGHVADIREAINEAAKIIYGSQVNQKAHGGRIKKAPGGIMNLGGLEKDYRTTGGFVPLGGRERADDVPARLSKNEFVMTADAVRAAGGGSINRGAQRMYNTMKHLEANPQSKRMTV